MREKSAVALFLIALGGIKWYEYRSEEWEDSDIEKDYLFEKAKKKIQRRSIDGQTERWMMQHYSEEMLEVQHGAGIKAVLDCSRIPEEECSCNFLQCFGQPQCQRNVTGAARHTFVRCRSALVYDQVLCECKRHTQLPDVSLGGGGRGGRSLLGQEKRTAREQEQEFRRRRHRQLLREQQMLLQLQPQSHVEPPLPDGGGGGGGIASN